MRISASPWPADWLQHSVPWRSSTARASTVLRPSNGISSQASSAAFGHRVAGPDQVEADPPVLARDRRGELARRRGRAPAGRRDAPAGRAATGCRHTPSPAARSARCAPAGRAGGTAGEQDEQVGGADFGHRPRPPAQLVERAGQRGVLLAEPDAFLQQHALEAAGRSSAESVGRGRPAAFPPRRAGWPAGRAGARCRCAAPGRAAPHGRGRRRHRSVSARSRRAGRRRRSAAPCAHAAGARRRRWRRRSAPGRASARRSSRSRWCTSGIARQHLGDRPPEARARAARRPARRRPG